MTLNDIWGIKILTTVVYGEISLKNFGFKREIMVRWNYTMIEQFKTFGVLDFYVKIDLMVRIDY